MYISNDLIINFVMSNTMQIIIIIIIVIIIIIIIIYVSLLNYYDCRVSVGW